MWHSLACSDNPFLKAFRTFTGYISGLILFSTHDGSVPAIYLIILNTRE